MQISKKKISFLVLNNICMYIYVYGRMFYLDWQSDSEAMYQQFATTK